MTIVSVHEAEARLSQLLKAVQGGEKVIIARAGKPVARLVPFASSKPRRQLGLLAGRLTVSENFDAPLPDDVLALFEGR